MDRKEAERAAVVGIDRWFVWLRYDWEVAEEKQPPSPPWARALLGDDFFANLVYAGYASRPARPAKRRSGRLYRQTSTNSNTSP